VLAHGNGTAKRTKGRRIASTLNYLLDWVEFTISFTYYDFVCKCISSRQYIFHRLLLSFVSYVCKKGSALLVVASFRENAGVGKERTCTSEKSSVTPQAYSYIQQRQRVGIRKSGKQSATFNKRWSWTADIGLALIFRQTELLQWKPEEIYWCHVSA
jgi:hypothetical protein